MRTVHLLIVAALLFQSSVVSAQVVQLPSIRQFSYRGSVLVPDRGTTFLGGNRTSATASRSRGLPGFGPFPQSHLGGNQTAAGVSVSATIIDHDEIDRRLLGEDPRSIAWRARNPHALPIEDQLNEIKSLVRNARSLFHAGRMSTSRSTYDLAIERIVGLMRQPDAPQRTLKSMLSYAGTEYDKLYGPFMPIPYSKSNAAGAVASQEMWP